MEILKNIKVPTGNILIVNGEKGKLECLSIGDYGKEKNIKADFLGLTKEINGVPNGDILSLEKKWVITVSTQYGCSMNCIFCDVPKVGRGINATKEDIIQQVFCGISLHPEIKFTSRLNVHFARMGEPTFNPNVLLATEELTYLLKKDKRWGFHPVISTMCPKNNNFLYEFIDKWIYIKNEKLNGEAGLQLSINTTNETEREKMFSGNAETLENISKMFERLLEDKEKNKRVIGRKIALNFAITDKEIDGKKLRDLFNPAYFMCKITPMHENTACNKNGLITKDGYTNYYPYKKVEEDLNKNGFDVIVFVPSKEEDESKITCGNAILADKAVD